MANLFKVCETGDSLNSSVGYDLKLKGCRSKISIEEITWRCSEKSIVRKTPHQEFILGLKRLTIVVKLFILFL